MNRFIGVKIVNAKPMTKYDFYRDRKGFDPNMDNQDGYKVVYPDGYESWCPKRQFEEANRSIDGMSFGHAIECLKKGFKVARKGWNGKGMFLFMRPEDDLPINILLGAKSLPKTVKDFYERKHQPIIPEDIPKIKFTGYICMKAADDTVVNGWLASQTDILADDWEIID